MLKKINCIFRHDDIFDFLYVQFNTVRDESDGNGIEGKRVLSSDTCENSTFLKGF